MKCHLKTLLLVLLTLFIMQQNLLAVDPMPTGGDTVVIQFNSEIIDFADPFALKVKAGDVIKFEAVNGEFTILIQNANSIFEGVGYSLEIHIDSSGNDAPQNVTYTVKSGVIVGSEVQLIIYCINQDKWIEDAPPRIIIVPRD
jgi:hypothetical protein